MQFKKLLYLSHQAARIFSIKTSQFHIISKPKTTIFGENETIKF